jgi:hypothetical protein
MAEDRKQSAKGIEHNVIDDIQRLSARDSLMVSI